ncbi:armadillo-type protein [Lineolata rhizophorae]|uniref:Armadillo-type protein n=1 Tax=Lineolata rhizophorae TaxID=578093 RepID=A0A6A6P0Q2_9PEZI|nr:armadillo-type protein [Lineolata rhizophorae]
MPAMSRGSGRAGGSSSGRAFKIVKRSKKKGGTESSRKHHFESFTERISKLNIDPVRRARRHDFADEDLSAATSYFKTSFDEWRDMNLSENFTAFARKMVPLCETLPQILLNQERIVTLLVEYIDGRDALSLEPLLSLVAQLAHDLGARFEPHFAPLVGAVSRVAATHPDVEPVEWSFECLAWLFKFLSRLLVPDLRPLFDLVAPLLGARRRQRPFVVRFAAEALSFLLRKAGATYRRDGEPLRRIVRHALRDVEGAEKEGGDVELYKQGLMTLFVESIKGVQQGIHSSGEAVFTELLSCAMQDAARVHSDVRTELPQLEVLFGVLVAVIHHTNAETFKPIFDIIHDDFLSCRKSLTSTSITPQFYYECAFRLRTTVLGVRRGSRILDWDVITDDTQSLIDAMRTTGVGFGEGVSWQLVSLVVMLLQYTPMEYALKQRTLAFLKDSFSESGHLPTLWLIYAKLGVERFQFHLVIPMLAKMGCFDGSPLKYSSEQWDAQFIRAFESIAHHASQETLENDVLTCNNAIELLQTVRMGENVRTVALADIEALLRELHARNMYDARSLRNRFIFGNGLRYVVETSPEVRAEIIWPILCKASGELSRLPLFWANVSEFLKRHGSKMDYENEAVPALIESAIGCLSSPSHCLRMNTLEVLATIYDARLSPHAEVLSNAVAIESTPLNIQTVRAASMRVRRLALTYASVLEDPWLGKAIPAYLFGLLYVKMSQIWEDACNAFKDIVASKTGEEVVAQLAIDWIMTPNEVGNYSDPDSESPNEQTNQVITEFECTNLNRVMRLEKECWEITSDAPNKLRERFEKTHAIIPARTTASRSQALQVLNVIPQVAEKKSRMLVPALLRWALDSDSDEAATPDAKGEEPEEKEQSKPTWSRKDQKALLSVFAQFTNPKVLYKSTEVYHALLNLLANGDVEIQKAALKAVLAWKNRSINHYEENLMNILDDARFREQIAIFLDLDQDDSTVQAEHREDLMPVLLRLLYGKVVMRQGSASGKRGQETRRKAVFQALTRFEEEDIRHFLNIGLGALSGISVLEEGLGEQEHVGFSNDEMDAAETGKQVSIERSIRQFGFHCLHLLFGHCSDFDWNLYVPFIMEHLIEPRLDKFPIETAQSVSGILKLLGIWSQHLQTAPLLVEYNNQLVPKVVECLEVPFTKDVVKLFIMNDILGQLINLASLETTNELASKQATIRKDLLERHSNEFLIRLGAEIRGNPSKEVLDTGVQRVSQLAPFAVGDAEAQNFIDLSLFLLRQPRQRVSHKTKRELLPTLHHFIPKLASLNSELLENCLLNVCGLFEFYRDAPGRLLICDILDDLAEKDSELKEVAALSRNLNSMSEMRLDEPDFERRGDAYTVISGTKSKAFAAKQWLPLLYNMMFYIKEEEEMVIRTSAAHGIRRFVEAASDANRPDQKKCKDIVESVVLPCMYKTIRDCTELIRVECLSIVAEVIRSFPDWSLVSGMHVLLVGDDDEASFFTNVLHIQQHRRLRALRRLAAEASKGAISGENASQLFIPLVEHFIFDKAEDDSASNLAAEAITTVGALAGRLRWGQYKPLLRKYVGSLQSKEDQKTVVRLLSATIDALSRAGTERGDKSESSATSGEAGDSMIIDLRQNRLSETMPSQEDLSKDLAQSILPILMGFLHHKDESTVSVRVPVAIAMTKLLLLLPPSEFASKLPPVLTDICHILRSRAPEARDMTRKTLADIASLIGPKYFGFLVKELRTALQRGYQLHVLSFTVHSILVFLTPSLKPGDLNYCLPQIMDIIMDDIFGVTGEEKDAEEYISKMKEVKSSKSYDSMELIAKITTLSHLVQLIRPIQMLLQERLDAKIVKKIDELQRRIGLGVLHNESVNDRDILIFCYEVVQEVYKSERELAKPWQQQTDHKMAAYLVNLRGAKDRPKDTPTSHFYKMVRFALDLLRTVLNKHNELQTPQNLAGFMPIIGDAIVQGQEEVQTSAIRLLTTIIRVPLSQIDKDAHVFISEAVRILRAAVSTNTELAQAALKLVAAILRERKSIEIKEGNIAYLLKRIKPDLEEPDKQGVTFNFLKAVLSRKMVIAEVYEIMDVVGAIMVTNQTRAARDLARGVYFQFLMEYPQARGRLSKQLAFLVKNLDYQHAEGRQSVMEAIHLLLTKVGDNLIQDILGTVYVPLVMVMTNDESAECREMAGALVKSVFERADKDRMKTFTSLLRAWLEQDTQLLLKRVSVQCWLLYFDAIESPPSKDLSFVLDNVSTILLDQAASRDADNSNWEILYYGLQAFSKFTKLQSSVTFAGSTTETWLAIQSLLAYPHAWVKLTSARLVGAYFADFASATSERKGTGEGLGKIPLVGSGGLELDEDDLRRLAKAELKVMGSPSISEELAKQTARNLAFLGRCFGANGMSWTPHDAPVEAEDDSEEEWGGIDEEDIVGPAVEVQTTGRTALHHLLHRLSVLVRSDPEPNPTGSPPALHSKSASLQLLAALANALPAEVLLGISTDTMESTPLMTLLTPLAHLTDPAIPIPAAVDKDDHKTLVGAAQELLSMLQKKVGTDAFVRELGKVREGVRGRREERRRERVMEKAKGIAEMRKGRGRERIKVGKRKRLGSRGFGVEKVKKVKGIREW